MIFVEKHEVIELHNLCLIKTGEESKLGVLNEGLLESAVNAPKMTYYYQNKVSLFYVAALYLSRIAKNHSFIDGNKRTGLLTCEQFLLINDYLFEPPNPIQLVIDTVLGNVSESELALIIETHSIQIF